MGKFQDISRFLLAAGGSSSADGKSTLLFYEEKNALVMETWTGSELSDRVQVVAGVRADTSAPVVDLGYKRVFVTDQNNTLKCFTETLRAEDEDEEEDEEEEDDELWEAEELYDVNVILHPKSQLAISCDKSAITVFYQNPDGTLGAIEDDGDGWKVSQLPKCEAFPGTPLASFQAEDAAYLFYVGTESTPRYMEHSGNEWKDAPFSSAHVDGATAKLSVAEDEKAESSPEFLVFCLADNKLSTIKRESTGVETLGTVKDGEYKPASDQECGRCEEGDVAWNHNSCRWPPSAPTPDRQEYYAYEDRESGEHIPRVTLVMDSLHWVPFDPYYPSSDRICSDFNNLRVRDPVYPEYHQSRHQLRYPLPPPPPPYQPSTRPYHVFQSDHDERCDDPLEEATPWRTAQRPDARYVPQPVYQRYDPQESLRYQPPPQQDSRYHPSPDENLRYRHPQPPPQENTGYPPLGQENSRYQPDLEENSRYQHPPQENTQYPPHPQETSRLRRPPPPPPKVEEVKEEVKVKEEEQEQEEEEEEEEDYEDGGRPLPPPKIESEDKYEPRQRPPPHTETQRDHQLERERGLHALRVEHERFLQCLREQNERALQAERERLQAERERLQSEHDRAFQAERDRAIQAERGALQAERERDALQAERERDALQAERERGLHALRVEHERSLQSLREQNECAFQAERERLQSENDRALQAERQRAFQHHPQPRNKFKMILGVYVYVDKHRCKLCHRQYRKNRRGEWFKACGCLEVCEHCGDLYKKSRSRGVWVKPCRCPEACKLCHSQYRRNRGGAWVKTCRCLEVCEY